MHTLRVDGEPGLFTVAQSRPHRPARPQGSAGDSRCQPATAWRVLLPQLNLIEEQVMRVIVKLLFALGIGAALAGCVVAPVGPPRGYVAAGVVAPAPVVVVQGGYYWHRW